MRGPRLRLLLALLVLTAFTLTAIDYRAGEGSPFDALRRGSDTVFGPAQRTVGGAARSVGNALGGLPRLGRYQEDNRRLERENARLRALLRETDGLRRSDAELKKLLQLRPVGQYAVIPARVVSVGSALGFEWTATLDAGSRDGVKPGQTVLTGDGLVGRTKRVSPFTTVVVLLLDPTFTVGARLQRLGGVGLASGLGSSGMQYELIDQDAQVRPGDVLATTQSDTFVPDVPVGRVTRVVGGARTLTRTTRVDPFVDVSSLDLVGVVVGPARMAPRTPVRS
ncbi:MAG: rod shape-determining protein MreC [Frankiales bacterium]|nr:rod shape-determining protein MreC [Frankiales bacterium]